VQTLKTLKSIQIITSIDSSPEILSQIQEIVVPIIVFTLENRLLGEFSFFMSIVDTDLAFSR